MTLCVKENGVTCHITVLSCASALQKSTIGTRNPNIRKWRYPVIGFCPLTGVPQADKAKAGSF